MLLVVYGLTLMHLSAYGLSVCWQLGSKAVMGFSQLSRGNAAVHESCSGAATLSLWADLLLSNKSESVQERSKASLDYAVNSVVW